MLKALALTLALLFSHNVGAQPAPMEPAVAKFKQEYEAELKRQNIVDKCTYTIVDRQGPSAIMSLDCEKAPNFCFIALMDTGATDIRNFALLSCRPKPLKVDTK